MFLNLCHFQTTYWTFLNSTQDNLSLKIVSIDRFTSSIWLKNAWLFKLKNLQIIIFVNEPWSRGKSNLRGKREKKKQEHMLLLKPPMMKCMFIKMQMTLVHDVKWPSLCLSVGTQGEGCPPSDILFGNCIIVNDNNILFSTI